VRERKGEEMKGRGAGDQKKRVGELEKKRGAT
jgi:hypothetical protein